MSEELQGGLPVPPDVAEALLIWQRNGGQPLPLPPIPLPALDTLLDLPVVDVEIDGPVGELALGDYNYYDALAEALR